MGTQRFVGVLGLLLLIAIAFTLSEHKRRINRQQIVVAIGAQFIFALLVLGIPAMGISGPLQGVFVAANRAFLTIITFTLEGSSFIFGPLADSKKVGFLFAFQVLPTIIFMACVMSIFYHWGLMQRLVGVIAFLMQKLLKTSGAETLSVAANIFVGQTEAPLMIKPYVKSMTRSELLAVMVGGMATVAGGVMAAYVGLLKDLIPNIAGHLLTASVMSAPAALAIAKMMIPEVETPVTLGKVPKLTGRKEHRNVIEAAAAGAGEGLKLALNVGAMLLAFIALISGADFILQALGDAIHFGDWGAFLVPDLMLRQMVTPTLSLSLILGWVFAPIAFVIGVPVGELGVAGSLLGQKIVLNEFVAYLNMSKMAADLSDRTMIILSYALCGFANFSSIAIQIGGIGGMAPSRRGDIAALGIKAVIGGSLAAFMTAAIAGILM